MIIYNISYWLHIISYILWLVTGIASLFFAFKVGKNYQTSDEIRFMKLERKATSIGAHVGAVGILISGSIMAMVPGGPQWGWFNIPLYNWLAIKQLLFIVILILVGFSIKRSIDFKKESQKTEKLVTKKARSKWRRAYTTSLIIYFLVAINTYLGLTKSI